MRGVLADLWAHGRGRVLLFCWLGWVFDFYDLILFAFLKVEVARELALELETQIAWIDGWTLLATAVGGVLFGRLADRVGRRFALSLSILVYSGGAFATAFADSFTTLLLARLITGIGVGGEWGVGHAVVAETYPVALRDRAHGILQAGSPVAMALAAAVGCFLGPVVGWRTCFLLSAAPALLVFFARTAMPGPDRAPGSRRGGLLDLFRGPLRRTSAVMLLLLTLHMTGFWCVYAWLPATLLRDAGVGLAFVGGFQIAVNSVHVFADVAFGFLASRFGRIRMFVLFCLLFTLGQLLVALGLEELRDDLVWFGAAVTAMGLGAGTWSCFGALFGTHYPEHLRATAASSFYNVSRGAQLLSQPLMGWLFLMTGSFAVALYVGAAMSLLSAGAILALPRDRAAS